MKGQRTLFLLVIIVYVPFVMRAQDFVWPEGKKMAISLTFDDARTSAVDRGYDFFREHQVQATYYVMPSPVKSKLTGWKKLVADGHEIGNHSYYHPCSINFGWTRDHALENYTLAEMKAELIRANDEIEALLGVRPTVFAYPCGQTYVKKGRETQSYVPIVAELFVSGRGWLDEAAVDPVYCDMAQLTGIPMDDKTFEELKKEVDRAMAAGQWLIFAGHELGESGQYTTRATELAKLIDYIKANHEDIWLGTVGEISTYVESKRP